MNNLTAYSPTHLCNFISVFNSDAIRDIKLIKGAFPAKYNPILSSVSYNRDILSSEKLTGEVGLSLISSHLALGGQISKDIAFNVSGRVMNRDLLFKIFSADEIVNSKYSFYDMNLDFNYKISDNDWLFVSGYYTKDKVNSEFENIEEDYTEHLEFPWENQSGSLRWLHSFSTNLSSNISLIYTDYSFITNFENKIEKESSSNNTITSDITFLAEAHYLPLRNHEIKTGFIATKFEFSTKTGIDFADTSMIIYNDETNPFDASFFLNDTWQITSDLSSNIGGRIYYYQTREKLSFDPSLSLTYELFDDIWINSSFTMVNQYLPLFIRKDITRPYGLDYPTSESLFCGKSNQSTISIKGDLFDNEYFFSLEGYYRDDKDIYEYLEIDYLIPNAKPIEKFTNNIYTYGFEFIIQKKLGAFNGLVSYHASWSMDNLDRFWHFYPHYSMRYDVSIVLSYKPTESWEITGLLAYGPWQPYTMPTGRYNLSQSEGSNPVWLNKRHLYTAQNISKVHMFQRFDFNIKYNYQMFDLAFQIHLGLYLEHGGNNPFTQPVIDDGWVYYIPLENYMEFPKVIPNMGINFKF